MARTLAQLLQDANSYLALDSSTPTGTDETTWTNYANQAVFDATAVGQFPEFQSKYLIGTSGGNNQLATMASVSLPAGFREFTTAPHVYAGNSTPLSYPQINAKDAYMHDVSERYCYVLGNPTSGYTAIFNALAANATISFDFQRYPSGFATLTDICELSDDTYVTAKIISYVLQARSDDRFPTAEATAGRKLQNMLGRASKTPGGGVNTTPKQQRYRIGE